ncbi:aspartate carbamoyltransferase catalytic subunit [Ligilactobacillus equi]|uniref:aspartate carbamoyltransferase catalytic subunit n=1 Tax=Ligilactobacillus equi TaxID=137357 RepID=UPI002ED11773
MSQVSLQHFVNMEQLSSTDVLTLIKRAQAFKAGAPVPELSQPVYCANLFFENSTRTHTSFEMAERKLGLTVIPFDTAHSSVSKGETLYDTALTLGAIGVDLTVIRHSQNDYYQDLLDLKPEQHLEMGIINAGDGSGQHPSQSMLDLMTIYHDFGYFRDLKVLIVGDLLNSRVARSNMQMLKKLGAKLYFAGPNYWFDAQEFGQYGQKVEVDQVIDQVDVVMLLRVQHERHEGLEQVQNFDEHEYNYLYGMNQKRYDKLKKTAIILHPGPINRGVEWDGYLVEAAKSRFVTQMENGVFMRMAMLEAVLRGRKLGGLA